MHRWEIALPKKTLKTFKTEAEFERAFVNVISSRGWGVSPRLTCRGGGWPDRQAIINGITVYLEFKLNKNRAELSTKQKKVKAMLEDKGALYFVVHQDNKFEVTKKLLEISYSLEGDVKWTSLFEV